jgi:hypothetical protein
MIESLADRIVREYDEEIAHWTTVRTKGLLGRIRFNRYASKQKRLFPKGLAGFLPKSPSGWGEYIARLD